MTYRLTIPGRPIPKGRPRFTRTGHAYTPKATKEQESRIRELCREHFDEPIVSRVSIKLEYYITGKRPADIDNLIKLTLDGLQPTGILDDSQVDRITAERISIINPKEQRTEVIITGKKGATP